MTYYYIQSTVILVCYAYHIVKFSHHSTPTVETDASSVDGSNMECEEKLVLL